MEVREILYLLLDLNKISPRLKPSNDRGEFEFYRAKRKNKIAENSFALGHEMDNTHLLINSSNCPEKVCTVLKQQPTHSV